MKNTFWTLLKESVIISGILALALIGALIYMAIAGMEIPEILAALAGTAVGFFMGGNKVKTAVQVLKNGKPVV